MAKKDLYKYDDLIFKRTDGNTYSSDPQTNNQRARSQYFAEHQGAGDLAASRAGQDEVNAYDALQLAAWQASQNQPTSTTKKPDTTPAYPGGNYGGYSGGATAQTTQEPWSPTIGSIGTSGFSYEPAPEYIDPYQQQIRELTDAVLNRGPFSYNYETDPAYQQYAKAYGDAGRRAMQDTLAQISARTGGLASSYAGSASQQAYNNYMARLADKVPELREAAYQMYLNEDNLRRSDLSMLQGLSDTDYGRFQDTLGQWNTDRAYDTSLWRYGVDDARYADETAYERNLALAQLAAGAGDYRGLRALGIDTSTAEAKARAGSGGGGGGGGSRSGGSSSTNATDDDVEYKPSMSEAAARANIGKGNFSPEALAAYEYYNGIPYADTVTTYDQAAKMLTGMGVTEKPVTERAWKSHKSGNSNAASADSYITDYDSYAEYLQDYLKTAQEVVYGF